MEKHQSNTQQAKKTSFNKKEWNEKRNQRRRLWKNAIKAVFGDKCQDCGYDKHWEILEFHHVIPRKISGRPSLTVTQDWKWEQFRDEHLEHCVLVCPTCHKERHINDEHESLQFTNEADF